MRSKASWRVWITYKLLNCRHFLLYVWNIKAYRFKRNKCDAVDVFQFECICTCGIYKKKKKAIEGDIQQVSYFINCFRMFLYLLFLLYIHKFLPFFFSLLIFFLFVFSIQMIFGYWLKNGTKRKENFNIHKQICRIKKNRKMIIYHSMWVCQKFLKGIMCLTRLEDYYIFVHCVILNVHYIISTFVILLYTSRIYIAILRKRIISLLNA